MSNSAYDDTEGPTVLRLLTALLMAEFAFGLTFWLGWVVAFLSLTVAGVAVTACLAGMLAVEFERAAVRLVTGWTPARLRLALTGWPVVVIVIALNSKVGWTSWNLFLVGIAAALARQAIMLHYLAGAREPA